MLFPTNTRRLFKWFWLVLYIVNTTLASAQFTSQINCLFPAAWEGKETKLIRNPIGQPVQIDTAFIVGRQATFTVNTTDLCSAYIWIEDNADDIHFLIDSPQINIGFDPQSSVPIVISGSPSSEIWQQQRDLLHQLNESQENWQPTFRGQVTSDDSLLSYIEHADSVREAYIKVVANLVENNPSLTSSWYLFATNYASFPYSIADHLFRRLETFKKYPSYQKIAADLLTKEPGKLATDFTLPTLSGESITLSDMHFKFTLIDFSDVFMLSCTIRHKALRKIYQTYHPLGLEILTVARAFDLRSAKEAFKTENTPWPVALSIIGQSKVATDYSVERTPDNVLFDQHKKIIARDLSPDELATVLSELVKK